MGLILIKGEFFKFYYKNRLRIFFRPNFKSLNNATCTFCGEGIRGRLYKIFVYLSFLKFFIFKSTKTGVLTHNHLIDCLPTWVDFGLMSSNSQSLVFFDTDPKSNYVYKKFFSDSVDEYIDSEINGAEYFKKNNLTTIVSKKVDSDTIKISKIDNAKFGFYNPDWCQSFLRIKQSGTSTFGKESFKLIDDIDQFDEAKNPIIKDYLNTIGSLFFHEKISVSPSHGDCSPWNVYEDKFQSKYFCDFQFFSFCKPQGIDLVRYIYSQKRFGDLKPALIVRNETLSEMIRLGETRLFLFEYLVLEETLRRYQENINLTFELQLMLCFGIK